MHSSWCKRCSSDPRWNIWFRYIAINKIYLKNQVTWFDLESDHHYTSYFCIFCFLTTGFWVLVCLHLNRLQAYQSLGRKWTPHQLWTPSNSLRTGSSHRDRSIQTPKSRYFPNATAAINPLHDSEVAHNDAPNFCVLLAKNCICYPSTYRFCRWIW